MTIDMTDIQIAKTIISGILIVVSVLLLRIVFPDMDTHKFVLLIVSIALIAIATGVGIFKLDDDFYE